ncbi:MAG: transcription termination factor NusA [Sulfuricurvum sp.]
MEKILEIADSIASEKSLDAKDVLEAIKSSFVQSAKRVIDSKLEFDAQLNEQNRAIDLVQIITVVADNDEKLSDDEVKMNFMSLSDAKGYDDSVEAGDQLQIAHKLEDYGRTGAAALHREIEYHIQKLVEDQVYNKYKSKIGTLVTGRVTRVDASNATYMEVDEVKAVLPMKSRIKGEIFKVGDHLKAVVRRVNLDKEMGIQIELSRTSPRFLEALLELEVPEIADGAVVIEKSSRIPGERAKVAVFSTHPQVDPVGATVGVKGVRINAVSQELNGENIDCIEFTNVKELFVSRAMSPAIVNGVEIVGEGEEKKAIVTLPSDQKSKAIGKSGINIRLASMLVGMDIELIETANSEDEPKSEQKSSVDDLRALFN